MKRLNLISLITVAIAVLMASGTNAQGQSVDNPKQYSISPAIEFGEVGTAFGIKGKIGVSPQFSIRPTVLFGYQPSVSSSNILNGSITGIDGSTIQLSTLGNNFNFTNNQTFADVGTGTAYGIALTYDFKSPDGKFQGYVGPSILFGSASRSSTLSGVPVTASTSETNIGLTGGTDFIISDNFTAGINSTYNISRSGSFNLNAPGVGVINAPISGGNFKFGINFGYNF
jgi:hypothetical protein